MYQREIVNDTQCRAEGTISKQLTYDGCCTYLMPMRIANRIASKKPSSHPRPTRHAVAATRTYAIDNVANSVNMNDREEMKMMTEAQASAIPAAP